MADRLSPLAAPAVAPPPGIGGLILSTRTDLVLWQVGAWPETAAAVALKLGETVGVAPPPFGRVAEGPGGALARLSPVQWLLFDAAPPALDAGEGTAVELSHVWTPIRLDGDRAVDLLARVAAVDLRERAFPVGGFAATGGHHLALRLWRRGPQSWEVFAMRSFARHLEAVLDEHGAQFGLSRS